MVLLGRIAWVMPNTEILVVLFSNTIKAHKNGVINGDGGEIGTEN